MKKALFTLLLSFTLLVQAGGVQTKSFSLPEVSFFLDTDKKAAYAGYQTEPDSSLTLHKEFYQQEIQSDELLIPIILTFNTLRRKVLPTFIPYKTIKSLATNDKIEIKGLLVLIAKSNNTLKEDLEIILNATKKNPNWFSLDKERLLIEKILIENADYKKNNKPQYRHGPKGFDFSKLNSNSKNKGNLPLLIEEKKENKN